MNRILLKVAAHDVPSAEEISFLREIKIELLNRFNGPSMRVDLLDEDEPPSHLAQRHKSPAQAGLLDRNSYG